jgi:nitrous oxidase accessory protein NosD
MGTTGNVAVSSIENVTIRGSDGYTKTNSFSKGILIQNQSYINIYNVNVYGTSTITNTGFGIYIEQSSTSRPIPRQYNVTSSGVYNYQSGVLIGNAVQGLTINQSNFVNNARGIYILPEATGIKQIGIVNSAINSSNGILISSPVYGLTISQCYIMFANDGSGIFLGTNGLYASILGNTFSARSPSPTGTNGIYIYGAQSTIITGNNFISVNIGVNILSTGSGITVQGNKYSAVTTDVSNDGKSNIIGVASD